MDKRQQGLDRPRLRVLKGGGRVKDERWRHKFTNEECKSLVVLKKVDAVNRSNTVVADATDNVPERITSLSSLALSLLKTMKTGYRRPCQQRPPPLSSMLLLLSSSLSISSTDNGTAQRQARRRRMTEMNNNNKDANRGSFSLRWGSWRRWMAVGGDSGRQQERRRSHGGI